MRLGKKKIAIGIALGTLLLALLSVATIGSASKCGMNCSNSETTELWLAAKTGLKGAVKTAYAASIVSPVKSDTSTVSSPVVVKSEATNTRPAKITKAAANRDAENFKKALVAILLVVATESIQQPVTR